MIVNIHGSFKSPIPASESGCMHHERYDTTSAWELDLRLQNCLQSDKVGKAFYYQDVDWKKRPRLFFYSLLSTDGLACTTNALYIQGHVSLQPSITVSVCRLPSELRSKQLRNQSQTSDISPSNLANSHLFPKQQPWQASKRTEQASTGP